MSEATETEVEAPEAETEEAAISQHTEESEESAEVEEVETSEEETDQSEAESDDLEEIEWEGIKARVPPAIKAGLMRTADYTRKTQEVAAERKALETRQAEITQQAEAVQSLAADYGKVHALDAQLKAFEAVDWDALDSEAQASADPISAQAEVNKLERQYRRLQAEHAAAKKELDGKVEEHRLQREREAATAMQETSRALADPNTGIKGWGPEKAAQLAALAAEEGVTVEELKHADARTWKLLNHLHEARAQLAKQTKASQHEKAQATTPAKTVKGGASTPHARRTTDASGDGLSMEEWARRERERVAQRGR